MRIPFGLLTCCFLSLERTLALPKLLKRDAPFDNVRTRLDRHHQNADEEEPDKYFHESSFHQHYDGRFAEKQLKYDERRNHLTPLVQTYLSSMNDIGAETWIMHGSLLGWWWNGKIMPWDSDIDVMISEKSIHHLAQFYNMTIHHYQLPGLEEGRDYLLEVNPHYTNSSLDTSNKIDARWIDTETGLFIDVTTLRRNKTAEAEGLEGAMMVKDRHHYMYDDIFPLRESTFESSPVKIPFAYADVLIEEYGEKALSEAFFERHRFDLEKQEWIPMSCRDFGSCGYFRNEVDGVNLPAGPHGSGVSAAHRPSDDRGTDGMRWAKYPTDSEIRPLRPRLLNNRPWKFGRWED